jgi:hypothetical protein
MIDYVAWFKDPAAVRNVLVEVTVMEGGLETTRFLSTRPYVTSPTDSPANQYYDPIIISGLEITEKIELDGQGSMSAGVITIANYNGERDGWLDLIWDNRSVKAYIGDPRWARGDFQLVFDGIVDTLNSTSADTLTLSVKDKSQQLNTPVTDEKIGGDGTDADNVINLLFGEAHNVTPQLRDEGLLEYSVHDDKINGIIEVRDNGLPVGFTLDADTGHFTLNRNPAGVITVSAQGDCTPTYTNTVAGIIKRIVTGYGSDLTRLSDADIDTANFTQFDTSFPQAVGYPTNGRENVITVCQALANSVDARMVMSRVGKLRLVQVRIPTSADITVDSTMMVEKSLKILDRPYVKGAVLLGFNKNWTVQADLQTTMPAAHKAMFAEEWLTATATDVDTLAAYKLNEAPVQVDTMLLTRTDAQAEAQRRVDIWSSPRTVFQFEGTPELLTSLELGDAVKLVHTRYGLANGKYGLVISIARNWLSGRATIAVLV